MNRNNFLYIFLLTIFTGFALNSVPANGQSLPVDLSKRDTLRENQILYNGKMWRNPYTMMKGDQFLFSQEYLYGSLTINGNFYKNILLNYDIYNDEILTPKNKGSIVQLNKEMVDSFTLVFGGETYRFVNTQEDSLPIIKGFVNVLYRGKSALYVKYKKEIESLAVDDKYDLFYQTYRIYFLNEGKVHQISNKSDLLKILKTDKIRIKEFMKKNRLRVSKKEAESFIPVIRYYDSISR